MEWISVKDRLPEIDSEVIVFARINDIPYLYQARYKSNEELNKPYFSIYDSDFQKKELNPWDQEVLDSLSHWIYSDDFSFPKLDWVSLAGHCEKNCMNQTYGCFCCEEKDDCDCVLRMDGKDKSYTAPVSGIYTFIAEDSQRNIIANITVHLNEDEKALLKFTTSNWIVILVKKD